MSIKPIQADMVVDFWRHMCRTYGIKIRRKSGSWVCKIARLVAGIPGEAWQRVSLLLGNTLYTDVIPGMDTIGSSLLGQVCLITHESQHLIQQGRDFFYPLKYLLSSKYRAQCESIAYTCNAEMYFYFTKQIIPVEKLLEVLSLYRLTEEDMKADRRILSIRNDAIEHGAVLTSASAAAIAYWSKRQVQELSRIRAKPVDNFETLF